MESVRQAQRNCRLSRAQQDTRNISFLILQVSHLA